MLQKAGKTTADSEFAKDGVRFLRTKETIYFFGGVRYPDKRQYDIRRFEAYKKLGDCPILSGNRS